MTAPLQHPWVDATSAPLYVWRVPPEPSARDLDEALRAIRDWVPSLDAPYGWINDAGNLRVATVATERRMLADHLRFVEAYSSRYCAGMSSIVVHPWARGIATAVSWLYQYPFPVHYAQTEAEARAWVGEQLQARARAGARSAGQSGRAPQ